MSVEVQAVTEILNITHALTGVGGAGGVAIIAGLIYKYTKKDLQESLISKEELKEHLSDILKDIEDLKHLNKDRIHNERDLYEKYNLLGQRVSTLEGLLSHR